MPLHSFDQARELIQSAKRIGIISHKRPDADAVGANLALREVLETQWGKTVTSLCVDPLPEDSLYLPKSETYQDHLNIADFDLFISVDCGGFGQLGFHEKNPEILDREKTLLINIDHHSSNEGYGTVNIVMPEAPSTCFILYLLFSSWGLSINANVATAMLHGLYYDTGSFMHPNVTPETYRIAGRLKALGGDHLRPVKEQFKNHTIPQLKLWGKAMERLDFNQHHAAVTTLTEEDFAATQTRFDESTGLVNFLNQIEGAKYLMLLAEDGKGLVKGSFRTQRDDVDVAATAQLFGGGGHTKAAGFAVPGRLRPKTIWTIEQS